MRIYCDRPPEAVFVDGLVHVTAHSGEGNMQCTISLRHFMEFLEGANGLVEEIANRRTVTSIEDHPVNGRRREARKPKK